MENEKYYDEDFIIYLTIDGTSYENVEVRVTDLNRTIRDQIHSIVQVFELPKVDNGGNPVQYLLAQMPNDGEEPEILDFENEDGVEQCLLDYDVQPGDTLHIVRVPVSGRQPIKVQVRGYSCKADVCMFEINNGMLWDGSVEAFIKYIVETLYLPIFDDGYYIDYSLSIWDGKKNIKCVNFERLWTYIAILMKNDTSPYGNFYFDLKMVLSGEKSRHRNRWIAMFEKWHRHCGRILYKHNL